MAKHIGSGKNRVVLDIDGTIFTLKWPGLGEWIPGAANFIRTLQGNGYEVMLFSTRLAPTETDEKTPRPERDKAEELNRVRARLAEEGLQDLPIWDKPWKPGGVAYIDDKAVHANGDWRQTLKDFAALTKPKTSMGIPINELNSKRLSPAGIRRRVNGGRA
jgi:hypothetical protein